MKNLHNYFISILCLAFTGCVYNPLSSVAKDHYRYKFPRTVNYKEHKKEPLATELKKNNLKIVSWDNLNGWVNDSQRDALRSFNNSCKSIVKSSNVMRPIAGKNIDPYFRKICRNVPSVDFMSNNEARKWFENNFVPYQIVQNDKSKLGLFTGYLSMGLYASYKKTDEFSAPIMEKPTRVDQINLTRKEIEETTPGRILYYAHPVDVFFLQIQGSGVLKMTDGKRVNIGYGGNNGQEFVGIGSMLKNDNKIPSNKYSTPSVIKFLKDNPAVFKEYSVKNKRYIYFKENYNNSGTIGAQGVPLTPKRSLAVDLQFYPMGIPVFVSTTDYSNNRFNKLMVMQDTGKAIKGLIRGDIFWGVGDSVLDSAGKQHSQGAKFLLLPNTIKF
ncbi:MAG: MltA domain-containing protein [Alphaproteobacteria bacterium]|nr:MltA domain-containing protein [Alphaproteobacteria bacterium]MBL0717812.1 MltA domain-containing protein [Alphaproteobacteria bacterium]